MLWNAAQNVGISYGTVQYHSRVSAFSYDNVELAYCSALRPFQLSIFSCAVKCLDVPCLRWLLRNEVRKIRS